MPSTRKSSISLLVLPLCLWEWCEALSRVLKTRFLRTQITFHFSVGEAWNMKPAVFSSHKFYSCFNYPESEPTGMPVSDQLESCVNANIIHSVAFKLGREIFYRRFNKIRTETRRTVPFLSKVRYTWALTHLMSSFESFTTPHFSEKIAKPLINSASNHAGIKH